MRTFTKTVIEKNLSIDDIANALFLHTDGNDARREAVLLATIQELASAIIAINKELEFRKY